MALTGTVNYTQTIPQSLGYGASEVTGSAGTVTAKITYNAKMGRLNTGVYGASESFMHGAATCDELGGEWEISGTETDVNLALAALKWIPRTYDDAAIVQDTKAMDRAYADHKGEALFEVEDRLVIFNFSIGEVFAVYTGADYIDYVCTKIESTKSGKRIYGVYTKDYTLNTDYTTVSLYDSVLVKYGPTLEIDNVVDYAIINPHGNSDLDIVINDNGGDAFYTTTLNGSLLAAEPYFSVAPPTVVVGNGLGLWSDAVSFGTVEIIGDEYVTVQLLLKRDQNDPAFDGDVVKNRPSYITDDTYGLFSVTRIGNTQAACFDPGSEVRWEFYGTAAQCTLALKYLQFNSLGADVYIETRLIVAESRIYNHRGYN